MAATPQRQSSGEAAVLSALSRAQLGAVWVAAIKQRAELAEIHAEFRRRFWVRQEENSAEGRPLELFPWDRDAGWHRKQQERLSPRARLRA
jgi:hypothetical protein